MCLELTKKWEFLDVRRSKSCYQDIKKNNQIWPQILKWKDCASLLLFIISYVFYMVMKL